MITLTSSASIQIKEMLKAETGTPYLRFGVSGGGCSGLNYTIGFDLERLETDSYFETNGIKIIINTTDKPIIEGTEIDFKQNLMGGGFTITNPNAIASCGCGSSFRTKKNLGKPEDC